MVTVRVFSQDDFVKDLKSAGEMAGRLELVRRPTPDDLYQDYALIVTGLLKREQVLRYEHFLFRAFRHEEKAVEEAEARAVTEMAAFKENLAKTEGMSFKPGVFEA